MNKDKIPGSLLVRHKRLAKYLGVSEKKAQDLLIKYSRSCILVDDPMDLEAKEKHLFEMIKMEEGLGDK